MSDESAAGRVDVVLPPEPALAFLLAASAAYTDGLPASETRKLTVQAKDRAEQFLDSLDGRKNGEVAATMLLMLEFVASQFVRDIAKRRGLEWTENMLRFALMALGGQCAEIVSGKRPLMR